MRHWLILLALGAVFPTEASEARVHLASYGSAAATYVNLQTWAEANQLQFLFDRKEEQIRLTNGSAQLFLKLNSLRAQVNGVSMFLSSPVILHQGVPSISQRELDLSLRPILFPPKSKAMQPVKILAISAGHGGKDCGNIVGSQQEKKFTLLLTKELQRLAQRAGFKTVLIRDTDEFVDLEDRARLAKRGKADLYVELHYNCAGGNNSDSKGVEVIASPRRAPIRPTAAAINTRRWRAIDTTNAMCNSLIICRMRSWINWGTPLRGAPGALCRPARRGDARRLDRSRVHVQSRGIAPDSRPGIPASNGGSDSGRLGGVSPVFGALRVVVHATSSESIVWCWEG